MANISGFPGYAGWGQVEAEADFRATGGRGKEARGGDGGGGGGSSAPPQLSMADLVKLREQAYNATQSYYEKIAKEAKGDFDTAVKLMQADYSQGTRQAKERLAYTEKYGTESLKSALDTLGVTFSRENEALTDTLNKRGMAVYQNNPDGTPNVVTPGSFNPTYDTSNYTTNIGGVAPQNASNTGRGGFEASRLYKDQGLRAEAEMRARMQPLEQAGLMFKQYTNPTAGFDVKNPGKFTGDISQLGTAESGFLANSEKAFQDYRNQGYQQAANRSQMVNSIAGQAAGIGQKSLDQSYINQIQKELNTDFVRGVK